MHNLYRVLYARRQLMVPYCFSRDARGRCCIALVALLLLSACGERRPAGWDFEAVDDRPWVPADAPYGVWNRAREAPGEAPDAARQADVEALEALGYLAGSAPASGAGGVTRHDAGRAWQGLNLYASGHGPEAVLMDMDGRVLHRWRRELKAIWPDYPLHESSPKTGYWRRVHAYPNGDLLAIFEGIGILRIDHDSQVRWAQANGAHHDLDVLPDGRIVVLTRKAHIVSRVSRDRPVLEDFVAILDGGTGEMQSEFSLLDAFLESEFGDRIWASMQPQGDVFHANTVEMLDGRLAKDDPAFAQGNLLVSLLYPNALGIVDPEQERALWLRTGPWRRQHHPTALENGRMLVFDNRGGDKQSRVIEFDPASGAEAWCYDGGSADPLYSWAGGSCYRLPNGNTLITESDNGRALEVTPEKETVWEFRNPNRAGDEDEFVATLFDLLRLPRDYFDTNFDGVNIALTRVFPL